MLSVGMLCLIVSPRGVSDCGEVETLGSSGQEGPSLGGGQRHLPWWGGTLERGLPHGGPWVAMADPPPRAAPCLLAAEPLRAEGGWAAAMSPWLTRAWACRLTDPTVEVVSAMQDLVVEEGCPAELLCQYSRPVQATWKMDKQEVQADGCRVIIEQDWTVARLSFRPALPCDSGIYSCEAAGTCVVALMQVQGEATQQAAPAQRRFSEARVPSWGKGRQCQPVPCRVTPLDELPADDPGGAAGPWAHLPRPLPLPKQPEGRVEGAGLSSRVLGSDPSPAPSQAGYPEGTPSPLSNRAGARFGGHKQGTVGWSPCGGGASFCCGHFLLGQI